MVFNLDTFISLCIQFPNVWYKSFVTLFKSFSMNKILRMSEIERENSIILREADVNSYGIYPTSIYLRFSTSGFLNTLKPFVVKSLTTYDPVAEKNNKEKPIFALASL